MHTASHTATHTATHTDTVSLNNNHQSQHALQHTLQHQGPNHVTGPNHSQPLATTRNLLEQTPQTDTTCLCLKRVRMVASGVWFKKLRVVASGCKWLGPGAELLRRLATTRNDLLQRTHTHTHTHTHTSNDLLQRDLVKHSQTRCNLTWPTPCNDSQRLSAHCTAVSLPRI